MGIKVSRAEAEIDQAGHAQVRRYLCREDVLGIGFGVSTFGPLPAQVEATAIWEAHDVPETHFVLSGHGIIREEDEEIPLAPGDVIVTPAGRRHVLWASGDEPLVTIYSAVASR